MARFQTSAPSSSSNESNNNWKADAFLNMYIRKPDGSRIKIGKSGISLSEQRKWDAAFIARMKEEGAVEALKGVVELDFQLVTDTPIAADSLGF